MLWLTEVVEIGHERRGWFREITGGEKNYGARIATNVI